MKCINCSAEVQDNSNVCPYCGASVGTGALSSNSGGGVPISGFSQQQGGFAQQPQAGYSQPASNYGGINPGTKVFAQWNNGLWYGGTVSQIMGNEYYVTFDDGASSKLMLQQITIESDPVPIGGESFTPGMRIEGMWTDGKWYPGHIQQRYGRIFIINFDDGKKVGMDAQKLRVLGYKGEMARNKKGTVGGLIIFVIIIAVVAGAILFFRGKGGDYPPSENLIVFTQPPTLGGLVLAREFASSYFLPATITQYEANKKVRVRYFTGSEESVEISDLRVDTISPGMWCLAKSASTNSWHVAKILQRQGTQIQVQYKQNNAVEWLNYNAIKISGSITNTTVPSSNPLNNNSETKTKEKTIQ